MGWIITGAFGAALMTLGVGGMLYPNAPVGEVMGCLVGSAALGAVLGKIAAH